MFIWKCLVPGKAGAQAHPRWAMRARVCSAQHTPIPSPGVCLHAARSCMQPLTRKKLSIQECCLNETLLATGTYYENAFIPVTIKFGPDYPMKPPKVYLPRGFLHINVSAGEGPVPRRISP